VSCGSTKAAAIDGGVSSAAADADDDPETANESTNDAPGEALAVDAATADDAETTRTMLVTFYGWDDNSPPGNDIAFDRSSGYPTVHDAAGGTGSYADPLTMATDASEIAIGTIVYVPFCQKYVVMEDDCTECDADWGSKTWHIDVWMNSNGKESPTALMNCEAQWTQNAAPVEIDPPPDLPVDTTPLFVPATNTCAQMP
jgi:3D (Asp-Asp-Asp) domain-containing protein